MIRASIAPLVAAGLWCGCSTIHQTQMTDLAPILNRCSGNIDRVIASPEAFRAQVLIAEVLTNNSGRAVLKRHGYRVGAEYFYPASTVKLCAAVAALQEVERLQPPSQTTDLADAPMEIAPLFPGDAPQAGDSSNTRGGHITVAHEMRKIALVSDNQAFNRLYDLVGHERLNRSMHELGLRSVVINHRLSEARAIPDMRASAAVTIRVPGGDPSHVPARTSTLILTNAANKLTVGNGHIKGKELFRTPMDFRSRNGISLVDLQDLLVKVTRPDIDLGSQPLKMTGLHRAGLVQAMTEYPRESSNPIYAAKDFPDAHSKFLLPGIRRLFPSVEPGARVESTGKNGRAYGFSIENSLVRNPANGRAVFVTAVIYTNEDGILNDDDYEYETVADPFFADLGELVARRWLGGNSAVK